MVSFGFQGFQNAFVEVSRFEAETAVAEASDAEGLSVGRSEFVFIQWLPIVSAEAVLYNSPIPPRERPQNQRFESKKEASQEQIDQHFEYEVGVSASVGGGHQRRQPPPVRRPSGRGPTRRSNGGRRSNTCSKIEKNPSLSPPFSPPAFSPSAVTTTTATDSNRSTNSKSESNSSSDGAFTSDYLLCSSGNSETSIENDVVKGEKRLPEEAVSKRIGVIVGDDSIGATITNSKNKWPIEEEKEQFSPVSVLDVPFEEDEDEVSSPSLAGSPVWKIRIMIRYSGRSPPPPSLGTKLKLMQKIRRLENLAQLQPVDLENQFSLPEIFTDESTESPSPLKLCSNPIQDNIPSDAKEKEIDAKRTALDLLELIKATFPSGSFETKSENLLLDLFRERDL
ncbi:hypothetical protein Acr_11g0008830 [Actinidia rufa]|uniref:Uncharacterized protein n=1 Tax=Actinidia rufa TaxID=165716 RepID=A0A7J0FFB4_9ERIC|nr:hypothetical protein Acr_11g0008830 [Actinidia rufa]